MLVLTSLWTRAGATSIRPCSLNINRSTGMGRHSGVIILNAPYAYILLTLYTFNRSTRQSFKRFLPYSDPKYTTRTNDFRFFSFRNKQRNENNEARKRGRCSGTSNSGQNCWTRNRFDDARPSVIVTQITSSLLSPSCARYIVVRAKNFPP